MKIDLSEYQNLRICVAVSGGRDSMALLHYLSAHAKEYNLTISAVNCDHAIRGEVSAADSAFVKNYCLEHSIPLICFVRDSSKASEVTARNWRYSCFKKAIAPTILPDKRTFAGADVIATAHQKDDNAETVLFNLARGSSLAGMQGIADTIKDGVRYIRPLISTTREEIDDYIFVNKIPYVDDETNFTDDYTRNKIRRHVLPELESAVPNATENIYRFSRLASEYTAYFDDLLKSRKAITVEGAFVRLYKIAERPLFNIAARKIVVEHFSKKDFTSSHFDFLYALQEKERGKRFEFLNLVAYNDGDSLVFLDNSLGETEPIGFGLGEFNINNFKFEISTSLKDSEKVLRFDLDKIPQSAVIRTMQRGDTFKKFGGGTKSLGDYFTDRKIAVYRREYVPVIASGSEILAVVGMEISDNIKVTADTKTTAYIASNDFTKN